MGIKEEWESLPGYNHYRVSNTGKVKRTWLTSTVPGEPFILYQEKELPLVKYRNGKIIADLDRISKIISK